MAGAIFVFCAGTGVDPVLPGPLKTWKRGCLFFVEIATFQDGFSGVHHVWEYLSFSRFFADPQSVD